ncbi:hypothetical protein [Polycladomyces subterraneus]|uniref:KTSC domain-containing protein n=1 Tax=Polycladomyces subterraneus TaxID=1016997 RepID=A0ABT8IQM9_9BACL|nr:hypothetical protein [Polycladomyces subterraneus]MDN4595069.1 hypothetical protein [Polycladomyces subterraneus]
MTRRIFVVLMCGFFLTVSAGCQWAKPPEQRQGLSNDSQSYTYVGYPESHIVQAAQTVEGVRSARLDYDGRRLILYVEPERWVKPHQYHRLERLVHRNVGDIAPHKPFEVKVLSNIRTGTH